MCHAVSQETSSSAASASAAAASASASLEKDNTPAASNVEKEDVSIPNPDASSSSPSSSPSPSSPSPSSTSTSSDDDDSEGDDGLGIDWDSSDTYEHAPGIGLNGWLVEGQEEFSNIEGVRGVRVVPLDDGTDRINLQYHVEWSDDYPDSWEHHQSLAEDVPRDYEESWFEALRESNAKVVRERLEGTGCPRIVLPRLIDKDGRVALHYAAGKGDDEIVDMILSCPGQTMHGEDDEEENNTATAPSDAYLNLRDNLGYTPLHMAAGYGHVEILRKLLEAGGNPEIEDNKGNTVLTLVEDLRRSMPTDSPQAYTRRVALDGVLKVALESIYDEVEPIAILDKRLPELEAVELGAPNQPEYLVTLPKGIDGETEDVWIRADDISPDLRIAYDSGLEVAYANRAMGKRTRPAPGGKGTITEYLVEWEDGTPDSWEPEDRVASPLADAFERDVRSLRKAAKAGAEAGNGKWVLADTKLGTFLLPKEE